MNRAWLLIGCMGWVACLGSRTGRQATGGDVVADSGADAAPDVAADVDPAGPRLVVTPEVVDFGVVTATTPVPVRDVALANGGTGALVIRGIRFAGKPGFEVTIDHRTYTPFGAFGPQGVTFDPPLTLAAGATIDVSARYLAPSAAAAEAELVLLTNDPTAPDGTTVTFLANVDGPCMAIAPARIDFGEVAPGASATTPLVIKSCGRTPLHVTNVDWIFDEGGVFTIDAASLGALPLALAPGASVALPVTYRPGDATSAAARAKGLLRIISDATPEARTVSIAAFDAGMDCPTPIITVLEGHDVIPQTVLHLDGTHSTSGSGAAIAVYRWTVFQPPGSVSNLMPSASFAAPTFTANVAGVYTIRLETQDELGTLSCTAAEYTVNVVSAKGLHVELLWHNPADINESDEGDGLGSDVDLHFLLPDAHSTYFAFPFDVCFEAPNPSAGDRDNYDDPRLDRDDTDGAGPENVNLDVPIDGAQYRVGANYWNDWGYGTAFVTLRVYIDGALVYHWDDVPLVDTDLWDICTIDWPSGHVTPLTDDLGHPRITPHFAGENVLP